MMEVILDNSAEQDRIALNRTYWRSRRGLLELDLVLPGFVQRRYAALSPAQQDSYQALLAAEDQDILAWLQGLATPDDPALAALVALILADHAATGR